MSEIRSPKFDKSWKPTIRQLELLELAAQEPGLRRSISALCKKLALPRRTFYHWLEDPNFKQRWNTLHREMIAQHLPSVTSALIFQAQQGAISAARLIYEVAGELKTRLEVTGENGGPIEISGARERIARRLDELAQRGRKTNPAG